MLKYFCSAAPQSSNQPTGGYLTQHHHSIDPRPGTRQAFAFQSSQFICPCSRLTRIGAAASHRARVLVIDDEPAIGAAIRAALREEHEVVVAHRAADALSLLTNGESFDILSIVSG